MRNILFLIPGTKSANMCNIHITEINSSEMRKSSQSAKKPAKTSMPKKSQEMGLGCAWCMFRTPALGLDGYPAMVHNLQVPLFQDREELW